MRNKGSDGIDLANYGIKGTKLNWNSRLTEGDSLEVSDDIPMFNAHILPLNWKNIKEL